ncbi:MAG TPA: hypothetical protein VHE53_05245 [Patescibacteria group bacterium]|nr:hypothetical protein [Patescibacteria group bacterium]
MGRGNKEQWYSQSKRNDVDPEFQRELDRLEQQSERGFAGGNKLLNSLGRIYGDNLRPNPDVFGRRPATEREVRNAIDRKKQNS